MATLDDVKDIISDQQAFADQKASTAVSLLVAAVNTILSQEIEVPEDFDLDAPQLTFYDRSRVRIREPGNVDDSVTLPIQPILKEPELPPELPQAEDRPDITHEVGSYSKPSDVIPFKLDPPDIDTNIDTDVTIPNYPVPTPPDLLPIEDVPVPSFPGIPNDPIDIPEFEGDIPDDLGQQYLDAFRQLTTEFTDDINTGIRDIVYAHFPKLETQSHLVDQYICDFMEGKESALSNIVEDAIYERGKNRIDAQYYREMDEARLLAVETGNPVLQPRVRSAMLRVVENAAVRTAEHALGTAEQRAIRELEQLQFCMTMVKQMRDSAIQLRNQEFNNAIAVRQVVNQVASKFVDTLIDIQRLYLEKLNADIATANLKLEKLKSDREFILIELEIYKGQLEGQQIKASINRTQAEIYATEARVLQILYEVVNTEIELIKAQVEVRRLPAEIYAINAEAYKAYVSGLLAETETFKALIDGDVATIQGQVARLDGWVKGREADSLEIQLTDGYNTAISNYNRNLLQVHELESRLVELEKNLEAQRVQNETAVMNADVTKFEVDSRARLEEYRTTNNLNLRYTELQAQLITAYERIRQGYEQLLLAQSKAIADVYNDGAQGFTGMSTAALSGINTLASLSDNVQRTE